jgi:hypothetical protein
MSLGMIFLVIALILFFLDGIGVLGQGKLLVWGLFSLTLGLLLGGISLPFGH